MRPRTMVALNVAGTVSFISVFFWMGGNHSPLMLLRWAAFFGAGLLMPMRLSGKIEAELARLPAPVPPGLRRAAIYPVWVGIITLGTALALIQPFR